MIVVVLPAYNEALYSFIPEPKFSCMVDFLIEFSKLDQIVEDAQLKLRNDQKKISSKMNVRNTIGQTLSLLVRRRLGLS